MSNIHIKFSGIDEGSGAIFLQFASENTLNLIDQSTIHGFFPSQYKTHAIDELLPLMAEFGHQMLAQQTIVNENKFTHEQTNSFNQLIGTIQAVPLSSLPIHISSSVDGQYNLDSVKNPNSQVDQMRNIVLEILAEEGLILGKVK